MKVWGFANAKDAELAKKLNLISVILSAILVVAFPLSLALMAKKSTVTYTGVENSHKAANVFGFVLFILAMLHAAAIIALTSYVRFKLLREIEISN